MTSSDEAIITRQADVLSVEELEEAYQRWDVPKVVSVSDIEQPQSTLLKVSEVEALRKEAQEEGFKTGYDEGYQAGHEAGIQAAQHDIDALKQRWSQLIEQLAQPLKRVDTQIEQELVQLASLLARQVVFHELKIQPEQVTAALKAALVALPLTERKLTLFAHPDDIELLKSAMANHPIEQPYQWQMDATLTRGGVRIETSDTTIDASVETRLNKVIEKILGATS